MNLSGIDAVLFTYLNDIAWSVLREILYTLVKVLTKLARQDLGYECCIDVWRSFSVLSASILSIALLHAYLTFQLHIHGV